MQPSRDAVALYLEAWTAFDLDTENRGSEVQETTRASRMRNEMTKATAIGTLYYVYLYI